MAPGTAAEAIVAGLRQPQDAFAPIPPTALAQDPLVQWQVAADGQPHFPELDCLRRIFPARVPARTLALAALKAEALGTGADRVLIASGALDEEAYLRALGETLGIAFEPLDGTPRDQCPLSDEQLTEAAANGLLPLVIDDGLTVIVAPRGTAARRILHLAEENPATAQRFRFTSAERFQRFVLRYAGKAMAARASDALRTQYPMLSAATAQWSGPIVSCAAIGMLTLAGLVFASGTALLAFELTLTMVFLAWLALRLTGAFIGRPQPAPSPALPDSELPVYTVISALYREAASVDALLAAIGRLDYPAEKLDVIIAVEADDRETRAALATRTINMPITVVPVPNIGPRTKPKALNMALQFARGTFTVIYDAEDRPDHDQLRCALRAFRSAGDELACVQARLCIDNTADSWLTCYFTTEYAGQFDVFLPGLTTLALPLPLGGSSNHFRTETLRAIGAWDPYNVTEDADLGMRLARFGYRADIIDSTTYEEAPAHTGAWLRQRTRWFKGWMQTWLVHMREPRRLMCELRLPGFIAFQLMVGGSALAALVHPLFLAGLIYVIGSDMNFWRNGVTAVTLGSAICGTTAVIGYLCSAFFGWLGLMRRGLLTSSWVLLLTPLHWLLLSVAAWRALYQLVAAPYTWEKTEHGLAKSSRRAANMTRALIELERELTTLKQRGDLATLADAAINISAIQRQRHPASASG